MIVTVIGRGHSGTRAMSHTLSASGVFMGCPVNESGDLLPPQPMYDACQVIAPHIQRTGEREWDFAKVQDMPIPAPFKRLIKKYLAILDASPCKHKGWKIPETTLVYPWIRRLFPDIKYIFWVRDPRDCILNKHLTDDLKRWGVDYAPTDDLRLQRAISWKYQYDLVKATPRPKHWIEVRLEDFVLRQDQTLHRLEDFLGIKLARIPVKRDAVGRWKTDDGVHDFDFLAPAMKEYNYRRPRATSAV